jgi:hypothetical protein
VPDGTPVVQTQNGVTIINQDGLTKLGGFARATGWKVMWGLNLGTGSKTEAVEQAEAVNAALGSSLQSFQIGNEVDALRRFDRSYDAYHKAFLDYRAAIVAAVPGAPFSGPDTTGSLNWVTNFAASEAGAVKLLTFHYYRGGASDPKSTMENLLQRDERFSNKLKVMREICREHNEAFRINEINSFYGGGKAGVSDTFGSALWCLDLMFRLASYGCEGVNMQTDINQLGFISHYSPVVHDESGHCSTRPEYYGMLAFALVGKGEMVKLDLQKPAVDLSAFATRDPDGVLWITMVNKDSAHDAKVEMMRPEGYSCASVLRLIAPSLASKDQVTLGGAEVSYGGTWTPGPAETIDAANKTVQLLVPHASAALLQLRRN